MKPSMIALLAVAALAFTACGRSTTRELVAPAKKYGTIQPKGGQVSQQFNPRVDVLFVIDNSKSMLDEQRLLREASAKFVDQLGKSGIIDYRIGVITVHDDTHAANCKGACWPEGQLRSAFVARNDNARDQIQTALNVGVLEPKDGGPEFERVFSPIVKALSPQMNRTNGSFIRPDSRVVIVMVTDETDSSAEYSVFDFLNTLNDKNQSVATLNRIDLYGIVALDASARNNFAKDSAPTRIVEAVTKTSGKVFSITDSDFGKHLGEIVTDIRKRILTQEMVMQKFPDIGTKAKLEEVKGEDLKFDEFNLYYGDQLVEKGWAFNPNRNSIIITEDIEVNYVPGATFHAKFIEIASHSRVVNPRDKKVHLTTEYF